MDEVIAKALSVENIRATRERLGDKIVTTPARRWQGFDIDQV